MEGPSLVKSGPRLTVPLQPQCGLERAFEQVWARWRGPGTLAMQRADGTLAFALVCAECQPCARPCLRHRQGSKDER